MVKRCPLITSAVSRCVLYWFHRMVKVVWWMVRLALRLHQVLQGLGVEPVAWGEEEGREETVGKGKLVARQEVSAMDMAPPIPCTVPWCRMASSIACRTLLGLRTPALMSTWSTVLPAGHEVHVPRQVQLLLLVGVVLQLLEAALALLVLTVEQQVGPRRWLEGQS